MSLTQDLLKELFECQEGRIFWQKSGHGVSIGQEAGSVNGQGYRCVGINGKPYQTHRIIWQFFNGEIPAGQEIDHINGQRDDNRIENLRLVTHTENGRNRKTNENNTSGHKGVCWNKETGKWRAGIKVNRKQIHLGYFEKLEDAVAVRLQAEIDYFKDFRRH